MKWPPAALVAALLAAAVAAAVAPASAQIVGQLDLGRATVLNNPSDLANWPITTTITSIQLAGDGVHLQFSKKEGDDTTERWPDVTPPGWGGPIQYTMGMAEYINGHWYASAVIQVWYDLPAAGGAPSGYAQNWFYDPIRWGPMASHALLAGETVGIFVVEGNVRNVRDSSQSPLRERSNVVLVKMPAASFPAGGNYAAPAPAPAPTIGSSPSPTPSPTPSPGGTGVGGPTGPSDYIVGDSPLHCPQPAPTHPYRSVMFGFDLNRLESAKSTPKYAFALMAQDLPPTDACIRFIASLLGPTMGCLDGQDNFMLDRTRDGYIGYRTWSPNYPHWSWFAYNSAHPDPGDAGPAGNSPNCHNYTGPVIHQQ